MISKHPRIHLTLEVLRAFRVVTIFLLSFMCYWGWDAYQFVNTHYKELTQWQLAYYGSIVLAVIAAIRFWTDSKASSPHSDNLKNTDNSTE